METVYSTSMALTFWAPGTGFLIVKFFHRAGQVGDGWCFQDNLSALHLPHILFLLLLHYM